MLASKPCNINH